jgi:hypothetical protein
MATGRVPTTANSPLTAKGDLFTYSTAPARLAVGNDGETIVADSSTSTGLRYTSNFAAGKNKIINGDFYVNQRSFTSTTTTNTFGHDRWSGTFVDGTTTYSTQAFTLGAAPVAGYEGTNYARLVTTGQTLSTAQSVFRQRIEDVRTFAGQTVTVSFWAQSGSGTPNVAVELIQSFGTGGSPSASVTAILASTPKQAISTTWTRYSYVISVPSISGKTLGTTNDSFLQVGLWVSAGTDLNARTGSLGIQTNTFNFWGVQVEASSVATAFQTATGTLQGETSACQRYYAKSYNQSATPGTASQIAGAKGFQTPSAVTTGGVVGYIFLPITMRVAPTISTWGYAGGAGKLSNGDGTDLAASSASAIWIGDNGFAIQNSSGSSVTPTYNVLQCHYAASAEL